MGQTTSGKGISVRHRSGLRRAAPLVGLLFSGILIGLMLWSVPLGEILVAVRRVDPRWLGLGFIVSLVGVTVRGARWRVLLRDRSSAPPMSEVTAVAMLGLALNNVLPGKGGELVRVGMAARRFRCGLTLATTSVIVERFLDAIFLLAILAAGLALAPSVSGRTATVLDQTIAENTIRDGTRSIALISVFLLASMLLLSLAPIRRAAVCLISVLPGLGNRLAGRLETILERVALGLEPLRRPDELVRLSATTTVVWGSVTLCGMAVSRGVDGVDLGWSEAMVFAALSIIASAVPSVPGAWGLFEAGGLLALAITGAAANDPAALVFVFSTHATLYFSVVLPGIGAALWLGWRPSSSSPAGTDLPSD